MRKSATNFESILTLITLVKVCFISYLWFSINTAPYISLPVQKAVIPHLQIPGRPLQRPGLHGLQFSTARDLQPLEPLQPL